MLPGSDPVWRLPVASSPSHSTDDLQTGPPSGLGGQVPLCVDTMYRYDKWDTGVIPIFLEFFWPLPPRWRFPLTHRVLPVRGVPRKSPPRWGYPPGLGGSLHLVGPRSGPLHVTALLGSPLRLSRRVFGALEISIWSRISQ